MPKALIPLLAVTLVDVLGFSILIPILPFYAEHYGASPFTIGLIVATVALCGLVSSPILGTLSDRVGRKGILLITQIVTTISYVLLGIGGSLGMIFFARAIEGFAAGGLGVTQAYVADVTDESQRTRSFALLGATYGLAFVIGPAVGGALIRFGFAAPLYLAAATSLITIFLTIFMLPESHTPLPSEPTLRERLQAFWVPKFRTLLIIQFCFTLAFTMWVTVLALFVERILGFGPGQTSLLYACSGVIGVLMQVFAVGRLVDRFREKRVLTAGLICIIFAFAGTIAVRSLLPLVLLLAFWSSGYALVRPAMSTLLSRAALPQQRGMLLGAADALNNLAFIIGPLISTIVLSRDAHLIGVIPAFLVFVALLIAIRFTPAPIAVVEAAA